MPTTVLRAPPRIFRPCDGPDKWLALLLRQNPMLIGPQFSDKYIENHNYAYILLYGLALSCTDGHQEALMRLTLKSTDTASVVKLNNKHLMFEYSTIFRKKSQTFLLHKIEQPHQRCMKLQTKLLCISFHLKRDFPN